MRRMTIITAADWPAALTALAAVLRAGGVAAVPTETVYGLVTRWNNPAGRERIYALKQRPDAKQLQMLALDLDMAVAAGVVREPRLEKLAARFWPGALTVVCAAGAAADSGIGLRLPAHPFIRELLARLGEPLAATSANRSGEPPATTADAAVAGLNGEPDLLLDGGPVIGGIASTVVSLLGAELAILRPGPIRLEDLQQALEDEK